jgi:signal peptidase II
VTSVTARARGLDRAAKIQVGALVAAIGWILDQASKRLALELLAGGRVVDLVGPFYLELTFNPHAAFGMRLPWWTFPIFTLLLLVLVAAHLPRSRSALEPFSYGLLAAGALGNMTDRLWRAGADGIGRGEVVDFFASTFWPTFNVADACLTVGFVLLVLAMALQGRRPRPTAPRGPRRAGTR